MLIRAICSKEKLRVLLYRSMALELYIAILEFGSHLVVVKGKKVSVVWIHLKNRCHKQLGHGWEVVLRNQVCKFIFPYFQEVVQ